MTFFGDPIGTSRGRRPFPFRLSEEVNVSGLKTASGLAPRVSTNPEVAKAVVFSED
jgi:hypothetical protein